jgi:hypothetical protein
MNLNRMYKVLAFLFIIALTIFVAGATHVGGSRNYEMSVVNYNGVPYAIVMDTRTSQVRVQKISFEETIQVFSGNERVLKDWR